MKKGAIAFEDLLSEDDSALIKAARIKRNLWSHSPELGKLILSSSFAALGAELSNHAALRIGYDLLLEDSTLPTGGWTLQDLSSLNPVACGLLLDLTTREGLFIRPDYPYHWATHAGKLLIVYGAERLLYLHTPRDPFTHELKKAGYVFGDAVTTSTHPITFRK
jgi:hypothetical protein